MGVRNMLRDPGNRRRFAAVFRSFFLSSAGKSGIKFVVVLLVLMLTISGLNVLGSYVGRDFMSAIEHRNMENFARLAFLYLLVFAAMTGGAVYFRFCEERLGLLWREWLTRRLANAYVDHCLDHAPDEAESVGNPDQRITEDVKAFTTTTLSFVLMLLNGLFTAIAFSSVLISISPLLFGVAVLYAAAGSAMAVMLGRPLIGLNVKQLDREADFRSMLIHLREHAEAVTVTQREVFFRGKLGNRIHAWANNAKEIIAVNRNLSFFTTSYNYAIQIIPALIVAPMFFRGKVEFGVITQSAMAFATLLGAFSLIVTQFQSISSFMAVILRLSELAEAIENAEHQTPKNITIEHQPRRLEFDDVTLWAPHSNVALISHLNWVMPERAVVLVDGPSGHARQAMFRALVGRWPYGEGRIVVPPRNALMELPERPYFPPGTLRHALWVSEKSPSEQTVNTAQAIRLLGLEDTLVRSGGMDVEHDWPEFLSLGEQQMLSCVRVMGAKPDIAVLDRPTTALGEADMLRVLDAFRRFGICLLVMGGAGERPEWFDAVLKFNTDGTWSYQPRLRAVDGPAAGTDTPQQGEMSNGDKSHRRTQR